MIEWPDSLVGELAERRCVVVLGAGASAACEDAQGKRPPDWRAFLTGAAERVLGSDSNEALQLISDHKYLDAAQVIVEGMAPADFTSYVREVFHDPEYQPSELHELVRSLDPKIVVTTNYDTIYERLCQSGNGHAGYNVCRYYDGHLVNDIRSRMRVILKAHGCVSDPSKIVLTRKQYFAARRDFSGFYAVLDALLLTNTLLFIGCGLDNDPDIQLVLENAYIAAPSSHPHYALTTDHRHDALKGALTTTYNLSLLEYKSGQHGQVVDALRDLDAKVVAKRAIVH